MKAALTATRHACIGLLLGVAMMATECVANTQNGFASTAVHPQIRKTQLRSATTGAQLVDISISQTISISDLDLSRKVDVATLTERIETLALSLCRAIDESYPLLASAHKRKSCARRAVREALAQVTVASVD